MRSRIVVMAVLVIGMFAAGAACAAGMVAGQQNLEGQFAFGATGGLAEPKGQLGNEPDWSGAPGESGLDLHYGWNGSAFADFYLTGFLAAGLSYGQSEVRMRNQQLPVAGGTETYVMLLRGRTSYVGLHVKAFLPTQRSWSPYALVGVAHSLRKVDISRAILDMAPGTDVFDIRDDAVALNGAVGIEQQLTGALSLTTGVSYFYSGAYEHDLPWMGHEMTLGSWQYWSADVGLTWHAVPRPGTSPR